MSFFVKSTKIHNTVIGVLLDDIPFFRIFVLMQRIALSQGARQRLVQRSGSGCAVLDEVN